MARPLTIVMYHYVRDLARSRYPKIKGLDLAKFRGQLEHIRSHYEVIGLAEAIHALRAGDALPPNAALLTFDDGYIEHFTNVFPLLHDAGLPGAFFPPVATARDRELLDVNRIHFLLAVADASRLAAEVDEAVEAAARAGAEGLSAPAAYRAELAAPNRFDDAETIYVKRMLQRALPEDLRGRIARDLFARHVSADETAFACELYAGEEQFRVMRASGMEIGAHGDRHYWLASITDEEQETEIRRSKDFLGALGCPVDEGWTMCYPYGNWDERLLKRLDAHGCALGLTTEVAVADLDRDAPLTLPRLDTNDLPQPVLS